MTVQLFSGTCDGRPRGGVGALVGGMEFWVIVPQQRCCRTLACAIRKRQGGLVDFSVHQFLPPSIAVDWPVRLLPSIIAPALQPMDARAPCQSVPAVKRSRHQEPAGRVQVLSASVRTAPESPQGTANHACRRRPGRWTANGGHWGALGACMVSLWGHAW